MLKRILSIVLCAVLLIMLSAPAMAEEDYIVVTIKEGDTVRKLCKAYGRDYDTDKYIVMVLNGMNRESQMETLTIGATIKIPKAPEAIQGSAPHLISSKDQIEYYVIPYVIQRGDTLKFVYKLWGLRFDDYAPAIRALNGREDLDTLYVGDLFLLPTTEKNLKTNIYTTVMSHVMLPNEEVASVYSRYGIDFEAERERLQTYNVKPFDQFREGDKLLIPLK